MSRLDERELNLAICAGCGTQFDTINDPSCCPTCDDPRASVPPTGQAWTRLADVQRGHKNVLTAMPGTDGMVYIIHTEPPFAIGQRAFLIRTSRGNVLWDLVALLDDDTIAQIDALGGVQDIVISHPHFYTTHLTWSRAFGAPVHLAAEDSQWLARADSSSLRRFIDNTSKTVRGTTVIKTGGHFPGSMVLLWEHRLFVADSVMVTSAGRYDGPRPFGTTTFAFLWSYPNRISLPATAISHIMDTLAPYDFDSAHAAFDGFDVVRDAKRKMRDSAEFVLGALRGIMPGEREAREFWRYGA